MVFLDPSVIWVILAVSFVSLGIGFWKKGGMIIFIGGVLLMFCGIFADGLSITGSASPDSEVLHYQVTSRTGQDDVRTSYAEIYAVFVSSSSSQLVGDTVNCATWHIKKSGAPDLNTLVRFGVWDNAVTPNLKYTFGTMNVTALNTVVTPVKMCNTEAYSIVNGDRIGVAWNDGDGTNRVNIDLDSSSNPFDSTTTYVARWTGAAWISSTGSDFQGILSYEVAGADDEELEFHPIVRIMIGLVGLMFMLVGIARYGPTV